MDDQPSLNESPDESDGEPDAFVPKKMAEAGTPAPVPAQNSGNIHDKYCQEKNIEIP